MAVNESKTIGIVFPGRPDDPRVVTLNPGATVAEAKEICGLKPGVELVGPLGGILADEEDLYEQVEDGMQLTASPKFDAGEKEEAFRGAA